MGLLYVSICVPMCAHVCVCVPAHVAARPEAVGRAASCCHGDQSSCHGNQMAMGTARRDSSISTVPCAPQGPAASIPSLVPPDTQVPHCIRGDTRGQGTVPKGLGTHGIPLTPILPQGPGPPGPLRHLRPLRPGVVLWAHAGDSRESGVEYQGWQWVPRDRGAIPCCHPPVPSR